jgi:hypothetical protein
MSRFREELRLIPPIAWAIAALLYLALGGGLYYFGVANDRTLPLAAKVAIVVLAGLPLAVMVLLVGYISRDAKRRGMRHVLWTVLAAIIPNGIGIILYFLVREPLMRPCPKCGTLARAGYAFCTKCAEPLAPACPQCRRATEPRWAHCAFCGAKL